MELRSGATAWTGQEARDAARQAAQRAWDAVAPGLGPSGAWKLVGDDVVRASQALEALEGTHLAPYQQLAHTVASHGGHSATAVLLAAGTVLRVLDAPGRLPGRIQGVVLARRQLLAWSAANARGASAEQVMEAVAGDLGELLLAGLRGMGPRPDADMVDVRTAPIDAPRWSPGLVLEPAAAPARAALEGQVAVLGSLEDTLRSKPTLRTAAAADLAALGAYEEGRRHERRSLLRRWGVTCIVCRTGDAETAAALAGDGILVVTDAPLSLVRRVSLATGARAVARPRDLVDEVARPALGDVANAAGALGHGVLRRRPSRQGGWTLHGDGPSATLELPGTGPAAAVRVAEAEAWLRAAAPALEDGRVLPGAGGWQRGAAADLRRAAEHAPGAAPLGIRAVAATLDALADALLENQGLDPSRHRPGLDVLDAHASVRTAVAAALDTASQVLRIDGLYAKRASRPTDLRGGAGPVGSPRGMPGDVPPLM